MAVGGLATSLRKDTITPGRLAAQIGALREVARFGRRYGARPVASVSVAWLENVFAQMVETPAAANELRKFSPGCSIVRFAWNGAATIPQG